MPTVSSGQDVQISSGQSSSGEIVLSGGLLEVLSGGRASGTIDSGGIDAVYSGGTAIGTVVSSGGFEELGRFINNFTISAGGTAIG